MFKDVFLDPLPQLPVDLMNLVNNKCTDLGLVLSHPQLLRYVDSRHGGFQEYMIDHANELLDRALSRTITIGGTAAYRLLAADAGDYFRPTIESGLFLEKARAVLDVGDSPNHVIGRIGTMTRNALILCPSMSLDILPFATRLLHFCGNRSVLGLFEAMTEDDYRMETAQKWFAELGWAESLEREVLAISVDHESGDPFKDEVFNRAEYVFRLIERSCETPTLCKCVRKNNLVVAVGRQFKHAPDFVKNAQWRALIKLAGRDTMQDAVKLVPVACELILETFEKLAEYRVLVIIFCTKMVCLSRSVFAVISEAHVPQVLISVLSKFTDATTLHNVFVAFLDAALRIQGFAELAVYYYVPVMISFGEHENYRVIKPCCIKVMEMFLVISAKNKRVERALMEQANVKEFIENVVKPYKAKVANNYGGFNVMNELGFLKNMFV